MTEAKREVGRPRLYDDRAEKQRAYRQRVDAERFEVVRELSKLRQMLKASDDHDSAALIARAESLLMGGRLPKK